VKTVVVVGTGVAGTTAAVTLRGQGYDGRLVLIGAEPEHPYRRPALTKEVLRGDRTTEQVRIKPEGWYAEHQVELLTGTTVTELDVARRTVTVDGARLGWDAVVLATGGRPRTLPRSEGAHLLRTAADVAPLRAELGPGARLLVVGAGFLGAEVAATACGLGCDVTMVEAAAAPLGRLLHRSRGVDVRTGVGVDSVERHGAAVRAYCTDGSVWSGEAVVVAVGMAPETELAEHAGLAVDGGIVVDSHGATAAPGVWAAGDAAAFPDPVTGLPRRREHWQSAMNQGLAVGRNLLGAGTPWTEVPWCWSDQHGVNLQVCGDPGPADEVSVQGDLGGSFTALFARDGVLTGAVAFDRPGDIRALRKVLATAPGTSLADALAG
jgi:3-phenylpropionate/trans-cinnamate dioxygenase ferredoxin reductase subunit